ASMDSHAPRIQGTRVGRAYGPANGRRRVFRVAGGPGPRCRASGHGRQRSSMSLWGQAPAPRFFSRMANLAGGTAAPASRGRRPDRGGIAAASAAPRAAAPDPRATPATPPHSPAAAPVLPPAAAASPAPRSPAPSPSPPDPATPGADRWPAARGSDGCRRRAPGRYSSAGHPATRSTGTTPPSNSGSP